MKTKNPLLQFLPYIKNAKRAYVLGFIYSVLNVGLGVLGCWLWFNTFMFGDIKLYP